MVSDDSADRPSWMPPAEPSNGKPLWNHMEGDLLVGQYVLVGITYVASDDKTATTHAQFHSEITKANENGIAVTCEGKTWCGQTATLPSDLKAFRKANPGEYRLLSTGKVVKDPDLLTTWTINEPSKPSQ
jgi:hypothetical protein